MTRRLVLRAVLWALALPAGVSAQPTDLYRCLSISGPVCNDPQGALVIAFCSLDPPSARYFDRYYGRIAWYPLRCVGPITVGVETFSPANTRFPLYVEVVPLRGRDPADYHLVCGNLPGNVVSIVYGESYLSAPCGGWDEVGPIDITSVVPLGSLYAIRVYFFGHPAGYSPAMDCIRVTAYPVESSVAPSTWGRVKLLFR